MDPLPPIEFEDTFHRNMVIGHHCPTLIDRKQMNSTHVRMSLPVRGGMGLVGHYSWILPLIS
jgi:hypothetical protein